MHSNKNFRILNKKKKIALLTGSLNQKIKIKIVNIEKETKRISLSYKATLENPWNKIKDQVGKEIKIKIKKTIKKTANIFAGL